MRSARQPIDGSTDRGGRRPRLGFDLGARAPCTRVSRHYWSESLAKQGPRLCETRSHSGATRPTAEDRSNAMTCSPSTSSPASDAALRPRRRAVGGGQRGGLRAALAGSWTTLSVDLAEAGRREDADLARQEVAEIERCHRPAGRFD